MEREESLLRLLLLILPRLLGARELDGGLEELLRDKGGVKGRGHGLYDQLGGWGDAEGRVVIRAEGDGLFRNRGAAESGGEVVRAVEIEYAVNGAQRCLAGELHRDGYNAVADRNVGEAELTARILRREVAVDEEALVQLVRGGGVVAKGVDLGLREAILREPGENDGIRYLVVLRIVVACCRAIEAAFWFVNTRAISSWPAPRPSTL